MSNLIYSKLSYRIVGAAYTVFNEVGYGLREKDYQSILAVEFQQKDIEYQKEVCIPLIYQSKHVKNLYADFIVDDKIILELKVMIRVGYFDYKQVKSYLKYSNKQLAIIIFFTKAGVFSRRIVNSEYCSSPKVIRGI